LKLGIVAMGLESSRDFKSAGVARYAYSLLDALVAPEFQDHELHFFLLPSFEVPKAWQEAPHVRIHRTWKRFNKWTLLVSGFVAKRLGLDFLFTTANSVPLWSPVPTGVFIHDLFPLDHPEWFPEATASVNEKTIPRAIAKSVLVLANSEATKADILRHFQVSPNKIGVTPLAGGNDIVPLKSCEIDRARLPALGVPFSRYFLTLSTIEPRKNLSRLLQSLALLASKEEFADVGLVVAGSKGWKYDDALAKIDSLGLQDRVVLTGYVDDNDLPLLFAASEFYICPSLSEGFGMPLVEAMSAGAPALSSNGGALPEVGGTAVRYFDPLNVESIAGAMMDALQDSNERRSWIDKGRVQAARFTWNRTARLTLEQIKAAAAL
jgi:glycosyltransferase involved in cell wall biosynthesis